MNTRRNQRRQTEPYFGDCPGSVLPGHVRIASVNIDNISPFRDGEKDAELCIEMQSLEAEVLLLQEVGVNWSKVPKKHQWVRRCKNYFEPGAMQGKFSHNRHDASSAQRQWGGTGVVSQGKLKHYAMGAGSDQTGLGRWTWAKYRGKDNISLRVVSIYQPCENKSGIVAVYAQHRRHLQNMKDDRDPRAAFKQDFRRELEEWINQGDHIIVGGDVNESIFHQSITDIFQEHGMVNAVFDRHSRQGAPTTYYRCNSNRIVDGMWVTPGITVHRSGYLEPKDFPGNHSLVWMDISYDDALGHNPPTPVSPAARRLKLGYSKTVDKYLKIYERLIDFHSLPQRQFTLEASTSYGVPLTAQQAQEAEAIDCLRTRCMLKAEKKCRKLRMGRVDFSPKLAKYLNQMAFWDVAIARRELKEKSRAARRRDRRKISSILWRRKKKAAKITKSTKDMSLPDMRAARRKAKSKYIKTKQNHRNHRKTFLKTLPKKDRDRLLRHERQRELGRYAKAVTGKLESKSVTKVELDGVEHTTKESIENVLFDVNYEKIRASDHTPFMTEPMVSEFGYRNNTDAANRVLDGTYHPPPGTTPTCRKLLHHMKKPTCIKRSRYTRRPRVAITTADHVRAFKKAKERTSAGMSGLHFGMFKAHTKKERLAAFDASMRSMAYTTGYAYKRWKKGLDVQLLKRARVWLARKLRTILLLEADFNMNNKAIGADAMRMGEHHGCLTRDNYGGRKGLQAAEVSMNAQLTYNSIWARRGKAVIMSNDAKGCYDRIAHIVVDLALRRLGVPKPALQSMLETIQEMEHHIRTAFGDSDGHYGHDAGPPPQGILQGNGAGPAGWFGISTLLIDILKQEGFGYKQWTLIRKRAVEITCFAFVDDTDIIHACENPSATTDDMLAEAQQALTLWEELLHTTGGALAPEKSYWYLLEVMYQNGRWKYASQEDRPGQLFLNNGEHCVRRHEPNESNEALGIQTRPDGSMQDEKDYLVRKVTRWCEELRSRKITGTEAWYCLTATITKTIEYPLVATTFSREDIDDIMRPIYKCALRICGIQRNLPRKLLYGPLEARGCGLRDPYLMQMIAHVTAILKHTKRDSPSHDLLDENMDLVQLYVGSDQTFWSLPFQMYGDLAPTGWIKNTWQALSTTNMTLQGPNIAPLAQRERDPFLMDAFIQELMPSPELLNTLQKCRLFLRAYRLSDICLACGSRIDDVAWMGQPLEHRAYAPWIPTERPTEADWIKWRECLRKLWLPPQSHSRRLLQPLGAWKTTVETDLDWIWWKDEASDCLYERREGNIRKWQRLQSQGVRAKYDQPSILLPTQCIPRGCTHATVRLSHNSTHATIISTGPHTITPVTTFLGLTERIRALPKDVSWACDQLHHSDNGTFLADCIRAGTAVGVSDGSLKDGFGTAAYVLEGASQHNRLRGVNKVPGPICEGDSHRCELAGIYGILTVVECICEHHEILSGRIHLACDNQSAVNNLDADALLHPGQANFDLVSAVTECISRLPITVTIEHVKGHQDSKKGTPLTRLENLNVEVDALAKRYWQHHLENSLNHALPQPEQCTIRGEGWQLWDNDTKVTQATTAALYRRAQYPATFSWWKRHNHISPTAEIETDWLATEQAMTKLSPSERLWVTKTASHNCGVGTTLVSWKYQDDAQCPRCEHLQETTEHVSQCRGQDASKRFRKSLRQLRRKLRRARTSPSLRSAMLYALKRWHKGHVPDPSHTDAVAQEAITSQNQIGWQSLVEGQMSRHWIVEQQRYLRRKQSRSTGRAWARTILPSLVRLGRRQWLHRNHYKHKRGRPRDARYASKLNHQIMREYALFTSEMDPLDHPKLHINLIHLLQKPLEHKKSWWLNVTRARKRYKERQLQEAATIQESRANSFILNWIIHGPR